MKKRIFFSLSLLLGINSSFGQNWFDYFTDITPSGMGVTTDLFFTDSLTGYVIGANNNSFGIWNTTDGGNSWNFQNLPGEGWSENYSNHNTSAQCSRIDFPDPQHGFAISGENILVRTSDSGQTWDSLCVVDTSSNNAPVEIEFADRMTGYLVTASDLEFSSVGMIGDSGFKTINGGLSWTRIKIPFSVSLTITGWGFDRNILFVSPDTGFGGGEQGWIYKTTDGAMTWDSIQIDSQITIFSLELISPNVIFAGGYEGGIISFDRGLTWHSHSYPDEFCAIGDTSFWLYQIHWPLSHSIGYATLNRYLNGSETTLLDFTWNNNSDNDVIIWKYFFTDRSNGYILPGYAPGMLAWEWGQAFGIHKMNAIVIGREEQLGEGIVRIFPQPSSGIFYFQFIDKKIINGDFSVWDNQGNKIYSAEIAELLDGNIMKINLQENSVGIYYWKIEQEGRMDSGRMIIEK